MEIVQTCSSSVWDISLFAMISDGGGDVHNGQNRDMGMASGLAEASKQASSLRLPTPGGFPVRLRWQAR